MVVFGLCITAQLFPPLLPLPGDYMTGLTQPDGEKELLSYCWSIWSNWIWWSLGQRSYVLAGLVAGVGYVTSSLGLCSLALSINIYTAKTHIIIFLDVLSCRLNSFHILLLDTTQFYSYVVDLLQIGPRAFWLVVNFLSNNLNTTALVKLCFSFGTSGLQKRGWGCGRGTIC